MLNKFSILTILSLIAHTGAFGQEAPTAGFAKPGSAIAVVDLFNLTDNAQYDPWERLLGRGLRRGIHTAKTQKEIAVEVIPYPRIHKALKDLGIDTHYIAPEQARAIGERLQSDLIVLGSFNVVEGVVATSVKIVDNHSGKLLHEETRFGTEEKISEFVVDLSDTLNELLLTGLEGSRSSETGRSPAIVIPTEDFEPVDNFVPESIPEPEPVESDVEMEPVEEGFSEQPMTQVAGPGGGAPPPSRGIAAPPSQVVAPPQAEVVEVQPTPQPLPTVAPTVAVQQMLNQSWQRNQGVAQPPVVQQPPPVYSQPAPPAAQPQVQTQPPPVQYQQPPQQAYQQPVTVGNPNGLPPRAPVNNEPIESFIPRLPPQQTRPPSAAVNSPFQPMALPTQPPPAADQLGYPMVPPMQQNPYPQGYPQQQTQPQRGPVGRFFNWVGSGFGLAEEPAPQPVMPQYQQPQGQQAPMQQQVPFANQPQQQMVPQQQAPQQQDDRRFLWIFDRN